MSIIKQFGKYVFAIELSLLALAASCSPVTPLLPTAQPILAPPVQPLESIPCPFDDQGEQVACKALEVPLDYTQPEGEKIKLTVAILSSSSQTPQPDPLIVLPASPAFSVLRFLNFMRGSYADLLAERQMIFYEPRAAGDVLACPGISEAYYELLATTSKSAERYQGMLDIYRSCRDSLAQAGVDLSLYSMSQHVADLSSLLQALGYEQVNLWGSGFGANLALEYLRSNPSNVRSIVADAVIDPKIALTGSAESLQAAFNSFFELCLTDARCQSAYPNLEREFFEGMARLNTNPATVEVIPFGGSQPIKVKVTGDLFLDLTTSLLGGSSELAQLPSLIHAVAIDRAYHLTESLQFSLARYGFNSPAANLSVYCAYLSSEAEPKRPSGAVHEALVRAFEDNARLVGEVCQGWYGVLLPEPNVTPLSSSLPVLILHDQFNPAMSLEMVEAYTQDLRKAVVVTLPVGSTSRFGLNPCAMQVIATFLQAPERKPSADCLREKPAIQFLMP